MLVLEDDGAEASVRSALDGPLHRLAEAANSGRSASTLEADPGLPQRLFATPGKTCQCIIISTNEGADAVRTVDATVCGPSRPKAAPARREPASLFFLLFTQAGGMLLLRLCTTQQLLRVS